ncbi:MAG: hypothetical protein J6U23_05650 [Clostridiales bacterium]|nr:hypothetical protein [Clostridiales bacterium]
MANFIIWVIKVGSLFTIVFFTAKLFYAVGMAKERDYWKKKTEGFEKAFPDMRITVVDDPPRKTEDDRLKFGDED